MTFDELRSALFNDATWPNWIGRLQSYYFDRECIPMLVDGRKYGLEFGLPSKKKEQPYLEQMPYRDLTGQPFFPVLDHRVLSLWALDDDNDVISACFVDQGMRDSSAANLARAMREGVTKFFRSHPQVVQYFFKADENFAGFIRLDVIGQAAGLNIMLLDGLAAPYSGFVISDSRSAT